MIVSKHAQGTRQWHDERARIITGSVFHEIVSPGTFAPANNDKSRARARMVASARVFGVYYETPPSFSMRQGTEREPEALLEYEDQTNLTWSRSGLLIHDDGLVGYSPDALVEEDGLAEVKCPEIPRHLENLLASVVPGDYAMQIQVGLYVSGRAWCDWLSFNPDMPKPAMLKRIRVYPDSKIQAAIPVAAEAFEKVVAGYVAQFEAMKAA